jgi:hypothetical protein
MSGSVGKGWGDQRGVFPPPLWPVSASDDFSPMWVPCYLPDNPLGSVTLRPRDVTHKPDGESPRPQQCSLWLTAHIAIFGEA